MSDITTKQKISSVAIELFAQKGYKDVSMREIAREVGIKASSLYKHYANKEAILLGIFDLFKEMMSQTEFPREQVIAYVRSVSPEAYLNEAFKQFKQVMWAPVTVKIAKIITMEQRRNRAVCDFFLQELIEKPNRIMKDVFDTMLENGKIADIDTAAAAHEYNAYIVYLYFEQNFLKESLSLSEIDEKMKRHNAFFARYVLKENKG